MLSIAVAISAENYYLENTVLFNLPLRIAPSALFMGAFSLRPRPGEMPLACPILVTRLPLDPVHAGTPPERRGKAQPDLEK